MAGASQTEIDEIEAFLLDSKTLVGPPPPWVQSTYINELQATWPISDQLGISSGALRFTCRSDRSNPSVSVIFRDRLIWRTDVVDPAECKSNPIGARAIGLPARVCGSHHHAWPDNRAYVQQLGFGRLPYRRPLSSHVRRLRHALPELAREINLTLDDYQRGFDVPANADLFGIPD